MFSVYLLFDSFSNIEFMYVINVLNNYMHYSGMSIRQNNEIVTVLDKNLEALKEKAQIYVNIQVIHYYTIIIWLVCSIIVFSISCLWADQSGKFGVYSNRETEWQACFTVSQLYFIPINATLTPILKQVAQQTNIIKANVTSEITGLITSLTCPVRCVSALESLIPPPSDITLPVLTNIPVASGELLNSLSYIGIQAVIYAAGALLIMNVTFKNVSWLTFGLCVQTWITWAMLTFYTVNPTFPYPYQVNATFVTLMKLGYDKFKFDSVNNGNNKCDIAYNFYITYLLLVLVIISVVIVNILLGTFGMCYLYSVFNDFLDSVEYSSCYKTSTSTATTSCSTGVYNSCCRFHSCFNNCILVVYVW